MTTASSSEISRPMSRSEWVSTLPPWRRLLATLNWHPVYDIEQETEQLRIRSLASEKRIQESEKRVKQIEKETEQIENETLQIESEIEHLKKDNARLAVLNSRMDALLRRDESSSQHPPSTGSN
jgi:septal ring factor EnvC (AmiA/AmiB activator)